MFNKTKIDNKFQPFTTAFTFQAGPYYYNLPTNVNGILIWDPVAETPKVKLKLNISVFHTKVEMLNDLEVIRVSGGGLSQIDNTVLSTRYSKSKFDRTIANYYSKTQTDGLLLPLTTDTTN